MQSTPSPPLPCVLEHTRIVINQTNDLHCKCWPPYYGAHCETRCALLLPLPAPAPPGVVTAPLSPRDLAAVSLFRYFMTISFPSPRYGWWQASVLVQMALGVCLHAFGCFWSALALAHLVQRTQRPSRLAVAALSLSALASLGPSLVQFSTFNSRNASAFSIYNAIPMPYITGRWAEFDELNAFYTPFAAVIIMLWMAATAIIASQGCVFILDRSYVLPASAS